jgi:hypothetical protein
LAVPPLAKRLLGVLFVPVFVALAIHGRIDILSVVGIVVWFICVALYAVTPGTLDRRSGQVLPDKALVPELIKERRQRREPTAAERVGDDLGSRTG